MTDLANNSPPSALRSTEREEPPSEPVAIFDSPETGWPSRIIDGKHVPCTHDGRYVAAPLATRGEPTFDLIAHIARAKAFSEKTFGPCIRTAGVVDHIRKELIEVEAAPTDLEEWVDVWMLALDGAWRAGFTAEQIVAQIVAKQTKNEGRAWPDWCMVSRDKAIEHDRSGEPDRASSTSDQPAAQLPQPYYVGGPYFDGSYSICDVSTARVLRTFKTEADLIGPQLYKWSHCGMERYRVMAASAEEADANDQPAAREARVLQAEAKAEDTLALVNAAWMEVPLQFKVAGMEADTEADTHPLPLAIRAMAVALSTPRGKG